MNSAKVTRLLFLALLCSGAGAVVGAAFGFRKPDLLLASAAVGLGFWMLLACIGFLVHAGKGKSN